jgi:hypothetical protein
MSKQTVTINLTLPLIVLTLGLAVLKLTFFPTWSWWAITVPIWGWFALVALVMVLAILVFLVLFVVALRTGRVNDLKWTFKRR